MHCYIYNVMNRILQLFSCFLLALHLGMPIILQADHGHFLGGYGDVTEQVKSDSCCPSDSHKPLDSREDCSICQRGLTSFGIFTVQSVMPEHRGEFFLALQAEPIPPLFFTYGNPKRGPPTLLPS